MPTEHALGVETPAIVEQMMGEVLHFEVFRPLSVNVHLLVLLVLPHTLLTLFKYILVIQTIVLLYYSTIWQYIAISPICICILTLSDVALLPFVSVFKSYVSLSVFMWWWYVCVCMCVCVCLCVCVCIPHLHHFYQYSLSGVYLSTFAYSRRFSFFFVYLA